MRFVMLRLTIEQSNILENIFDLFAYQDNIVGKTAINLNKSVLVVKKAELTDDQVHLIALLIGYSALTNQQGLNANSFLEFISINLPLLFTLTLTNFNANINALAAASLLQKQGDNLHLQIIATLIPELLSFNPLQEVNLDPLPTLNTQFTEDSYNLPTEGTKKRKLSPEEKAEKRSDQQREASRTYRQKKKVQLATLEEKNKALEEKISQLENPIKEKNNTHYYPKSIGSNQTLWELVVTCLTTIQAQGKQLNELSSQLKEANRKLDNIVGIQSIENASLRTPKTVSTSPTAIFSTATSPQAQSAVTSSLTPISQSKS